MPLGFGFKTVNIEALLKQISFSIIQIVYKLYIAMKFWYVQLVVTDGAFKVDCNS